MNIFNSINEAFEKQMNDNVKPIEESLDVYSIDEAKKDLTEIDGTIAEVLNRPENKAKIDVAYSENSKLRKAVLDILGSDDLKDNPAINKAKYVISTCSDKDLPARVGTYMTAINLNGKKSLNDSLNEDEFKDEGLLGNALKGAATGAIAGAIKGALGESKEPEDLWSKIYGEITEDGKLKMVNNSKGNYMPQINKGAGYDYRYVTTDTDGNIVIRADKEEDFKAAIDIADKYADKGVTYNIDKSKYLKVRPYFMTIEIPYEDKEDLDEGLSVVDKIKKLHPEIFEETMNEAKEPMNELFGIGEIKANYYVKKSDNEQFKEIDKKEYDNIVKAVKSLGDKAEIQKLQDAEKKGDGTEFTVKVKRGNPGTYYGMKIERIGANKEEKKLAKQAANAEDFEINVLSNGFVNIYNGTKQVATYESKEAAKAALTKLIDTVSKF